MVRGKRKVTKGYTKRVYMLAKLQSVLTNYCDTQWRERKRERGRRQSQRQKKSFIRTSETLEHAKAEIRNVSFSILIW